MFIGQAERSAWKPACMRAQALRARARARASEGHRPYCGKRSARYSAMARVSGTTRSPSISTGTVPAGLTGRIVRLKLDSGPKPSKRTITSSKSMPAWRISTQGRIDHEE